MRAGSKVILTKGQSKTLRHLFGKSSSYTHLILVPGSKAIPLILCIVGNGLVAPWEEVCRHDSAAKGYVWQKCPVIYPYSANSS